MSTMLGGGKGTLCLTAMLLLLTHSTALRCVCNDHLQDDDHLCFNNGTCNTDSYCRTAVLVFTNGSYSIESQYCTNKLQVPFCSNLPLNVTRNNQVIGSIHTLCCSDGDWCNNCPKLSELMDIRATSTDIRGVCPSLQGSSNTSSPEVTTSTSSSLPSSTTEGPISPESKIAMIINFTVAAVVVIVVLQMVITIIVVVVFFARKRRQHLVSPQSLSSLEPTITISESLLTPNHPGILSQRTIGDEIKLLDQLGRGSFGTVYLAKYLGKEYAIKEFHSSKILFFQRELEIYSTCMLTHNNILRFIAADSCSRFESLRPMLMFEFHSNGNLAMYLGKADETLSTGNIIHMCLSLLNGLEFLHREIRTSNQVKPGIAHRDLKSPNVLVKCDGSCCIADLGLAVRHDGKGGVDRVPPHIEGTRRYLPPEVLTSTDKQSDRFRFYRAGDIYSVSLILWEILNCSPSNGQSAYSRPYEGLISADPTEEEVRKLIVNKNERPAFKKELSSNEYLRPLISIIKEGWVNDPLKRPTSSNMRSRIDKIAILIHQ